MTLGGKERKGTPSRVVFLFDVDNTLLDNDRVTADLKQHLRDTVGAERQARYWEIFEQLRRDIGYADYLGSLQQYRIENPRETKLFEVSHFMIDYPFAKRLYPNSPDVVENAKRVGPAVILSDGDVVFQPRKIQRSGLGDVFGENILIYIHKEQCFDDVEARHPVTTFSWMTRFDCSMPQKGFGETVSPRYFPARGIMRTIWRR